MVKGNIRRIGNVLSVIVIMSGTITLFTLLVISIFNNENHYVHGFKQLHNCEHVVDLFNSTRGVISNCKCDYGYSNLNPAYLTCDNIVNGTCMIPDASTCPAQQNGRIVYLPLLCDKSIGLFPSCRVIMENQTFTILDADDCKRVSNKSLWGKCGVINGTVLLIDDPNKHVFTIINSSPAVALCTLLGIFIIVAILFIIYYLFVETAVNVRKNNHNNHNNQNYIETLNIIENTE